MNTLSFSPDLAAALQNGVVAVLPIDFSRQVPPIGVVWNQERPLSPSARLMMQCLEEVAAEIETVRETANLAAGKKSPRKGAGRLQGVAEGRGV